MRNTAEILLKGRITPTIEIHTGFHELDKTIGGLRGGSIYVLAGLEKSGKTSLLLNWISNFIRSGLDVSYISTEMTYEDVVLRMADIRNIKTNDETDSEKIQLHEQLETKLRFVHADELIVEGGISVTKTEETIKRLISEGSKIVIIDNLTTFGTQQTATKDTWAKIGVAMSKFANIAKTTNVPVIAVLHIKPGLTYRESPKGISEMVKNGKYLDIFEESVTIIQKPSLNDVYGGGGALSQIAGAFLLWRPYQKFDTEYLQKETCLILDSMRYSASGLTFRYEYEGSTGKFSPKEELTEQKILDIFN